MFTSNTLKIKTELDIQALRKGNRQAVKQFVSLGSHWIYNIVFSYVHNKEDAEEVVQDALIGALKGLDRFRNEASLKTWTYQIAINKSKDFLKYKTRQKRSAMVVSIDRDKDQNRNFEPFTAHHPGVQLEQQEDYKALWTCINQLPENQKQVLILAKIDKKSQTEISMLMGNSVKAVESLMSRAKANLKKNIENLPR